MRGSLSKILRRAAFASAGMLTAALMWGQFTSSIEGTVSDPSGSAIPNATITLLNTQTGIKTTVNTNGAGYFVFPSLPAGVFDITATGSGFKAREVSAVRLETGTRRTVNMSLEVGTQTTVVNVQAEAAAVELSDAKVAGMIESKQLSELPVPGRNYMALAALVPGVTGTTNAASGDVFSAQTGVGFNAAGQRSEQNGFAVDSGTTTSMVRHGQINLQPNTESIQEVQVTVNNFSAAAGSDAGAQVRVTTKSGTNDFHGSASWYHQDNVLSSRNIFQSTVNPANGRSLGVFRRNEAAGSFGGPVWRNHTFLFASFDILRQGTSATATSTVETPEFTSLMQQQAPNNKSTYLLTHYPAAFAPYLNIRTASAVLGAANCGVPTAVGVIPCNMPIIGDGITPVISIRNGKQWNLRGDHMIGTHDRFYANVYRTGERYTTGNTTRPDFSYPQQNLNWYGNVNETHTFSSSLLNEFRMSVVRVHGEIECRECQIPTVSVTGGLNGFGTGGPTPYLQNNYEWADQVSWLHGGHNVKAGIVVQRLQANWKPTASYQRPSFNFNSVMDFVTDTVFPEGNIGFNPTNGSVYTPDAAERQHTEAAFAEDTWKVKPNLTVTYGLRWETYGKINQTTLGNNVQWRSGNDLMSRIADGKDITKHEILDQQQWHNFAPRLSFAWDPKGDSKTSIRGGFGIFYDFMPSQLYGGAHYTPPIFMLITASAQTGLAPLYAFGASGTNPYQFPRPAGLQGIIGLDERNGSTFSRADITWVDPSLQNTSTRSVFFGIQRALTSTITVEANYVGNFGRHVYAKYNVNRFAGDLIQNNGVLKRLNPSFGNIDYGQANLNSTYNGGNVSLRKRYGHGLLFQGAYTFGHAIDQADGFGGGLQVNDAWNLALERGTAGFNVAQKLALSGVWELPGWNGNALAKKITGGWQLAGITILQTGTRFSVQCNRAFVAVRDSSGRIVGNSGCDYNADGSAFDRPNAPAFGTNINMEKAALLAGTMKAADFPAPGLGQVGNLGRNMYTQPGYASTDFSLQRNFKLPLFERTGGTLLEFRADAFNAFNRVNLGGIVNTIDNVNFGRVTGITGTPRRFQFGMRLSF